MKINFAMIYEQYTWSTIIIASVTHNGHKALVKTELREGRSIPATTLLLGIADINDEYIMALHEALDTQPLMVAVPGSSIMESELDRICD